MLRPGGTNALSAQMAPASSYPGEATRTPAPALQHLNTGVTVWDSAVPLTPVTLSETERRFRFRGLPQAIGAARRALREWESLFEPELFYDLSLCVSELVTNNVLHASSPEGDEIELAVLRDRRFVRAEVAERRRDVTVAHPPSIDCEDWGMFIVDRVADRWGVDRSVGTLLWCEIDLVGQARSHIR